MARYSRYPTPVLITGETGTGKELVARGLHSSGPFSEKPFIAVNCSTFTDNLFTSELFGYKKGAFTDAKQNQKGLIEEAEGGILFLDEIDSLSLKSQAGLLRLLQENEYRPVGSQVSYKANVRIIAATNRHLSSLIIKNLFREDLYYRLNILNIDLPALRDRKEDISDLIDYFLEKMNDKYSLGIKTISAKFFQQIIEYTWPGNVRELENTLHRKYLTSESSTLDEDTSLTSNSFTQTVPPNETIERHLLSSDYDIIPTYDTELNFNKAKKHAIDSFESHFISKIMLQAKGNVSVAASICGKERSALGKLVKKHNLKNLHI